MRLLNRLPLTEIITVDDIAIQVTRKKVKYIRIAIHPPNGHVTMSAPLRANTKIIRDFAESKKSWIRNHQTKIQDRARKETGYFLWGRQYMFRIEEKNVKPHVLCDHTGVTLIVRPDSDAKKRETILHEWHKRLLYTAIPPLLDKWQNIFGVKVDKFCLQRMKTRWGSCNTRTGCIRLNTELVKKPLEILEYVIAHETAHMIERGHNARFQALMDAHYPSWSEMRKRLNA
jgi:predicted metal-dependent hydrolase